jgi:hypothetical protein
MEEKLVKLKSLEDIVKIGTQSAQHQALLELYELYGNFDSLFNDATNSQALIILHVIECSPDLASKFVHSSELVPAIHLFYQQRRWKVVSKAFEMIKHGVSLDSKLLQSDEYRFKLFDIVLECVPQDDIDLSELALCLCELFIRSNPSFLSQFKEKSESYSNQSVAYTRFISLAAVISSRSDDLFTACLNTGMIEAIWRMCQSSDILTQIVAIELLRNFANTKTGLNHLFSSDIFSWLISQAYESFEQSDVANRFGNRGTRGDPLLTAQCLREVGEILSRAASNHLLDSIFWSSMFQTDMLQKFLHAVIEHIDSVTEETRLTGLKAVTDFTRTSPQALQLVVNDSSLLTLWASLMSSGKNELQAATLHSFARVLETNYGSSLNYSSSSPEIDIAQYRSRIWMAIGESRNMSTIDFLLRLTRQPVSNLRNAALDIVRSIIESDYNIASSSSTPSVLNSSNYEANTWGIQLFCSNADFRAYILDQDAEGTKEGREWKFSVVQAIVKHPHFSTVILATPGAGGNKFIELLRKIESRGPHYITVKPELQTMEN